MCPACRASLRAPPKCEAKPLAGALLAHGGEYEGALRSILIHAKERQALTLLPQLGEVLARTVLALLANQEGVPLDSRAGLLLVPIPTQCSHVVERGLDLPLELAKRAAKRLNSEGLTVRVHSGLVLIRKPADQSNLGRSQRKANLAGALRWAGPMPRARAILVDDIATTGATLNEAIRACRAAGVEVLGAAAIARTP
jgi:predicted amidophosphoribosyltransferase